VQTDGQWLTLPVSEFEALHGRIRALEQEIREVKITAGHRWCEETIFGLKQRVKELEVQIAGYEWGMSNAASEEHSLGEPDGE